MTFNEQVHVEESESYKTGELLAASAEEFKRVNAELEFFQEKYWVHDPNPRDESWNAWQDDMDAYFLVQCKNGIITPPHESLS